MITITCQSTDMLMPVVDVHNNTEFMQLMFVLLSDTTPKQNLQATE